MSSSVSVWVGGRRVCPKPHSSSRAGAAGHGVVKHGSGFTRILEPSTRLTEPPPNPDTRRVRVGVASGSGSGSESDEAGSKSHLSSSRTRELEIWCDTTESSIQSREEPGQVCIVRLCVCSCPNWSYYITSILPVNAVLGVLIYPCLRVYGFYIYGLTYGIGIWFILDVLTASAVISDYECRHFCCYRICFC